MRLQARDRLILCVEAVEQRSDCAYQRRLVNSIEFEIDWTRESYGRLGCGKFLWTIEGELEILSNKFLMGGLL